MKDKMVLKVWSEPWEAWYIQVRLPAKRDFPLILFLPTFDTFLSITQNVNWASMTSFETREGEIERERGKVQKGSPHVMYFSGP